MNAKNLWSRPFRENAELQQWLLFSVVVILYLCWLLPSGSMINASGDAADNWASITTWYSADRYGSYTLYKGFAAIYPHVWFYHLSTALHLNQFFFCMLYYAVLFAYTTVFAIPYVVETLVDYRPQLWQRVVLIVFLFKIWEPTYALSQLMVDLPSCAFFLAAVSSALYIAEVSGWRKIVSAAAAGLLAGLCANVSGQYSVAAIFVLLAAVAILARERKTAKEAFPVSQLWGCLLLLLAGYFLVKYLNGLFVTCAVDPLRENGAWIPDGSVWMHRALIYFIDKNRYLAGTPLLNPRGMAILQSMYGPELAQQLMDAAAAGAYGWTVGDYFNMVQHYPVDAVVQAVDEFFLSFSIDMNRQLVPSLVCGYSMFYLAVYAAVKRVKQWKDFLSVKTLIVIGTLTALLPTMVMTLEPRVTIGVQGVVFGVAILGDSVPQTLSLLLYKVSKGKYGTNNAVPNPWLFILWFIFVLFCMMHMGTLYAQSNMGTEMLFKLR